MGANKLEQGNAELGTNTILKQTNDVSRDRSCLPLLLTRIIWFGSTSVNIGPAYVSSYQRLGCLLVEFI